MLWTSNASSVSPISTRFMKDYSKVVTPLTMMTKREGGKYVPFMGGADQQAIFDLQGRAFTSAAILRRFDYDREIVLGTDASDYVSAGILSQYGEEGILHPVAFYSMKHSHAEGNYEIYGTEPLWRSH